MGLETDAKALAPNQQAKQDGYSQAVNEIKAAMQAGKEGFYSKAAMQNHDCLGEGCGVCGMAEAQYRKGVLQGARLGAKYPNVKWEDVE